MHFIYTAFHQGSVQATVISPNGQLLASAGDDGQAVLYRIQDGEGEFISGPESRQIRGHEDAVNDICFSSDNCNLMTCSSDGTIQLWDTETSKNRLKIQTKYGKLINVKFTPNGKRAVTLSTNFLSVWDLTSGKLEWELQDEENRNFQVNILIQISYIFITFITYLVLRHQVESAILLLILGWCHDKAYGR